MSIAIETIEHFGYSIDDTETLNGVEGIYIVESSEVITRRLEKVVIAKSLNLAKDIEVISVDGRNIYKYSVEPLYELSKQNKNSIFWILDGVRWEHGNVPTHEIENVRAFIENSEAPMPEIFAEILRAADKLVDNFPGATVRVDTKEENYLQDASGKAIGFDALWMSFNKNPECIEKGLRYVQS